VMPAARPTAHHRVRMTIILALLTPTQTLRSQGWLWLLGREALDFARSR
jgi:hypothetical protein